MKLLDWAKNKPAGQAFATFFLGKGCPELKPKLTKKEKQTAYDNIPKLIAISEICSAIIFHLFKHTTIENGEIHNTFDYENQGHTILTR